MASPRTRKRKQQRRAAKVYRTEQARWNALTREQKKAEDISRLWLEDCSESIKNCYASFLVEMLENDLAVTRRMADPRPLTVVGKSYTYAIQTNKKPPEGG